MLRLEGIATSKVPPGWHCTNARASKCTTNLTDPRDLKQLDGYGIALLRSKTIGDWIEMPFQLDKEMTGEVLAGFVKYLDRGAVQVLLDGKPVGKPCDLNASGAVTEEVSLGSHTLAAGGHKLRVQAVAMNPANNRCYIGLTGLSIRPDGAPMATVGKPFDVCLSDPAKTTTSGSITTMEWLGGARQGQHRIFFSALAPNREDPAESPACVRVADNAAAVALPQPALVVAGRYGRLEAETLVMAEDHLFAKGLTHGSIIAASTPIDIDWDFASGRVDLVLAEATDVHLLLESTPVQVNGEAASLKPQETGFCVLPLKAGRHTIENASPKSGEATNMSERCRTLLWEGREARKKQATALVAGADVKAPPLRAGFAVDVSSLVTDLITIPSDGGQLICAAEGKTVHVLSADGRRLRKLQADGAIRMLRWWPEHELLLVGCVDEQVIAFDRSWKRKWVFTSEMDPAVFRAAKTYWFKTAPGHEGIHGLHTGVFIDGKSQCFVGSACTLEIIDAQGQLIKRMPLFWGKNSHFQIVDWADGTLRLLAARKYSGVHGVSIVSNQDLKYKGKSFTSVPPGHSYVGGWSSLNRDHLFYIDMDGDGTKEVVSEINGTWNRVTVWATTGTALYDASFGPGRRIMAKNMRDLDIADLDRDGKQEILAATSSALVVALDHQCRKVWAKRLPSPATVMKCMAPKEAVWIVVGCEDGSVLVLDGEGEIIRKDRVSGRPTCVASLDESRVLLATTKGEVKLFVCGE